MRSNRFVSVSVSALAFAAALALVGTACAKHTPGASSSEAAAVAGDWSVWTNDVKVNAYHAHLAAKGAGVTATKVYDQDDAMAHHKKGEADPWCTFDIAAGAITGSASAGGAITGNVHGDGQGISLHSDKGSWELRRIK